LRAASRSSSQTSVRRHDRRLGPSRRAGATYRVQRPR
jgi:hypothetical protein